MNSEIPKSGPWSRVDFGISGPGSLKDQKSLQPESRNHFVESKRENPKHWRRLREDPESLSPFRCFRIPGVGRTRSLGELACRSPETPKRERCVGSEQRRAPKAERVHRFSQGLCQRTKGPVDLFKGFQQEPEEPFRLRRRTIQRPGGQNPAEVGGLHQVVSEPLFVCRLQAEGGRVDKENTLIHTIKWYQSQIFVCRFFCL
jgi:hypothetical protein